MSLSVPALGAIDPIPICRFLFQKTTSANSFANLTDGLGASGLRLELSVQTSLPEHRSYELTAYRGDKYLAGVVMDYVGTSVNVAGIKRPVFELSSDTIAVFSAFEGHKLISLVYVAAARSIDHMGGILYSPSVRNVAEVGAWQSMLDSGWATRGRERDQEMSSQVEPLKFYRFDLEFLGAEPVKAIDSYIIGLPEQTPNHLIALYQ